MINCLIIDDEQHAIDVLEHYIRQSGSLSLSGSSDNPLEALQLLQERHIDLIFLDIHMPQLSGLDFIKAIHRRYKVVLCTAYPNYAVEGFDLDVLDYLVKPIPLPRFLKTVQKAIDYFEKERPAFPPTETNDYILVKTEVKGKMLKINLSDIRFIEAMKNYVAIHHGTEKTLALLPMKELEDRLPANKFMRVHKSFIVSIQMITAIEGNSITLKNDKTPILLGESYREKFMTIMKEKLIGRP
ncbi:MAG TPA: LytTR family DNA-binding domain-containing protein [Puia sp.]|jgi:DNA-binding LytR/AlgR family response regulator